MLLELKLLLRVLLHVGRALTVAHLQLLTRRDVLILSLLLLPVRLVASTLWPWNRLTVLTEVAQISCIDSIVMFVIVPLLLLIEVWACGCSVCEGSCLVLVMAVVTLRHADVIVEEHLAGSWSLLLHYLLLFSAITAPIVATERLIKLSWLLFGGEILLVLLLLAREGV